MPYATVTKYDKEFTICETDSSQVKEKGTLVEIFNKLEEKGYKLLSTGGSSWELVFVFYKEK